MVQAAAALEAQHRGGDPTKMCTSLVMHPARFEPKLNRNPCASEVHLECQGYHMRVQTAQGTQLVTAASSDPT